MMVSRLSTPSALDGPAPTLNGNGSARRPRIALYSHDTQGLGHIRRNLLLARVFDRMGCHPVILLLSGSREIGAFRIPPSVDCMTLPAYGKAADGSYHPRSLGVPMEELAAMRRDSLASMLTSFDPDVLIVDKVPLGALDELEPALTSLRARGKTRCVLGLREILDDPASVAREWAASGFEESLRAFYDRIWVYGDPAVYDTAHEYGLDQTLRSKVRYTGYLNVRDVAEDQLVCDGEPVARVELPPGRIMLCEVGGGQDGVPLARAFMNAPLPSGASGVLITGPLMAVDVRRELRERAKGRSDVRVFEFVTDCCALLARADRVIAMGGYNTVCELLAYRRKALIVPRTTPRSEQLMRATRMAQRGAIDMLEPDALTAETLGEWMRTSGPLNEAAVDAIDFGGVSRLPELLTEVLSLPAAAGGVPCAAA